MTDRLTLTSALESSDMNEISEDDLYDMANLYPAETGLPMTVWVSPRGHARHDVRIKVNMTHGQRMTSGTVAIVGLRPHPQVLVGYLTSRDERKVFAWIRLNESALVDYWNGTIGTIELGLGACVRCRRDAGGPPARFQPGS